MSGFISTIFGVIIVFPFIVTFLLLEYFRRRGKAPSSVIGFAADLTTPFLFLAVYVVSHTIFGSGTGLYIAFIAIILTIVYAVIERLKVKEFRIVVLLRKMWRLFFLILVVTYILLLIVGTILKIVEYAR